MPAPTLITARIPTRSMGLKLLLVCLLAMLMTVPALFVRGLLFERTNRSEQVVKELGDIVGGPQTFLGPTLAVPYVIPAAKADQQPTRGVYVIDPARAEVEAATRSSIRHRSLFRAPVYTADLRFHAGFDLGDAGQTAPPGAILDWTRAELLMAASDSRGAQSDIQLVIDGRKATLGPAVTLTSMTLPSGDEDGPRHDRGLQFFGAPAQDFAKPGAKFDANATMKFSGAQRLAMLPYGKTTQFTMKGDWSSPSFDGGLLPVKRTVTDHGFDAFWSVPFIARGVPGEGPSDIIARLRGTELGVSFVEPGNPYQAVERSLKYAILFIGLVFLAYFLFEVMTGKRVHPAQYVLIGLAQCIFYLLLLSIAERLGFDLAFLIAAGATVSLISVYAVWVFESLRQGMIALTAFSLLYGLIYVLMRLEDLALLVGAVVSFAAITTVMYFTRRINWYGMTAPAAKAETAP